jgi:hypothetical protein
MGDQKTVICLSVLPLLEGLIFSRYNKRYHTYEKAYVKEEFILNSIPDSSQALIV